METIFKLYTEINDPNFIGQDKNAAEIFQIALNIEEEDYSQEKKTKYYEIVRWTVNHLAASYIESK